MIYSVLQKKGFTLEIYNFKKGHLKFAINVIIMEGGNNSLEFHVNAIANLLSAECPGYYLINRQLHACVVTI